MANETAALLADVLRNMSAPLEKTYENATPMLDALGNIETDPIYFTDGNKIAWPLKLNRRQGSGTINADGGTLNAAIPMNWDQATIDTTTLHETLGIGGKAAKAARGGANSWVNIISDGLTDVVESVKWTLDVMSHLNSDSLLASVTSASSGASTTVTVGTSANFTYLQPGTVVDFLVRSSGATFSLARKIESVDEAAGTIVVDSAIDTLTTHGLYFQGSWDNPMQGLKTAAATTGATAFEGIIKNNVPAWRGIDKSPTSADHLTEARLDSLERAMLIDVPHIYMGDPAVLDDYKHSFGAQAQWAGGTDTLATGWEYTTYHGKRLIYDKHAELGAVYRIPTNGDIKYVSRDKGPHWIDDDGSMWRHTARTLDKEAWYVWDIQLCFKRCNVIGRIGNLTRAE